MIRDLSDAPAEELGHYDVCVVGSGPAGGVVAAELAGSGLSVCVLESGRRRRTRHGDALKEVESEGIHVKDYSRERVLGGASTTWAGLSSPLDEIDLAARPWLEDSGWPIERSELLSLYQEAAERYRFPPSELFGSQGFVRLRGQGGLAPSWQALSEKVFLACAEPQDFGRELLHVYESEEVDLYLDATVTELLSEGHPARIEAARVRSSDGRQLRLRARAFVLACGGIENARLLLASRDLCPDGLGNEHDQVGRYLMNHPKNYCGVLHLARPVEDVPYYFGCLYRGYAGYAGLRLPESIQRERALLNSYVRLEPLFPWSDSRGVEALVLLVKRSAFVLRRWRARRADEVVALRDYSETGDDSDLQNARKSVWQWVGLLGAIALDFPRVARYLFYRLSRARPRIRRARLRNFMEMEPDPENRVVLSERNDPYGNPRARVVHRPSELDCRSLVALHEVLAAEVERTGLGRLESDLAQTRPWPITQDASHHMGTTRMGTDPSRSVVDPSGRLHAVHNVWMAGSSVFPTSGCANPTFTIVALSIRLARHLRSVLAAGPEARG